MQENNTIKLYIKYVNRARKIDEVSRIFSNFQLLGFSTARPTILPERRSSRA